MNKIIDITAVQHLLVDAAYVEQRLDNFLVSRLKGLPKSRLYRLLRKGEIRVNKKRVRPDYRVQAGDTIRIPPIRLAQPDATAKPCPQLLNRLSDRILYEDDGLLMINKPAGMAVHGGSGITFGVIETLRQLYPQQKYLELVHRLDKDTSGCLLIAKKPAMLKYLHMLMRSGKIEKVYVALVQGDWPRSVRLVDAPLYKNQLSSGERMVKVSPQGKASLTGFKVLQRFGQATLIEAQPYTGRTHQIRVHAAHAGHPLAADDKYGDKTFNKWIKAMGGKRLCLHAARLSFLLPDNPLPLTVKAPLPDDIAHCLKNLETDSLSEL